VTDGQYETPQPDRTKPRVSPRVVLASAGVVVATLFATVAALTSGSPDAAPTTRNPLEDVVSRNTLRSTPAQTGITTTQEVDALSSAEAPPTTTTTSRKTKVTTVTQPDGSTTTTTVEDTTPAQTTTRATVGNPTTTAVTTTTTAANTTTTTTTSSSSSTVPSSSANDGTGDQ
jgi:hypothetical protein